MRTTIICNPVSIMQKDVDYKRQDKADSDLQQAIDELEADGDKIIDIKVSHFSFDNKQGSHANEIWVQYTILSEERGE